MLTVGSVKFRNAPGTGGQKARKFDISAALVSKLCHGAKDPSDRLAELIEAEGDPWPKRADWLEALPVQPARVAREPHAVPESVTAADTAGEAAKLLAHIRDLQDAITNAGDEEG